MKAHSLNIFWQPSSLHVNRFKQFFGIASSHLLYRRTRAFLTHNRKMKSRCFLIASIRCFSSAAWGRPIAAAPLRKIALPTANSKSCAKRGGHSPASSLFFGKMSSGNIYSAPLNPLKHSLLCQSLSKKSSLTQFQDQRD